MTVQDLPALNATLNAAAAVLLVCAYAFIRSGRIAAHKRTMLAAFATSTAFLVSYLVYHFHVGSVPFQGTGWVRKAYFAILLTHTILAVAIVPLVLTSLNLGLRSRFVKHKRIARLTLPLWLYVSVTGVVIYVMLYRLGYSSR